MTIPRPVPRAGIMDIEAYVPGRSSAPGAAKIHKLSSNETPLGPSPAAVEAYRSATGVLDLYPDGGHHVLREAIAHRYGLDPSRIVCGNGSDDILHLLSLAYVGPGDEGIITTHGFLVFPIAIRAAGGTPVVAAEKNLTADVDAILGKLTPRTKIVYLANPNNPTGTYLPFEEIKRLHAGLPAHVVLVLDGAYSEYVRRNDYSAGLELAATCENVVMTRTFSKIHGLAGLRIGWAYAPAEICGALNRIRAPFNVNGAALRAGAAAIADAAHVEHSAAHNEQWLDWLTREITGLGLQVTPSVANFILIRFPQTPGLTAKDADEFLVRRGLIVRAVGAYGLPDCLRMTVGTEEANRLVVAALADFLAGKGDATRG